MHPFISLLAFLEGRPRLASARLWVSLGEILSPVSHLCHLLSGRCQGQDRWVCLSPHVPVREGSMGTFSCPATRAEGRNRYSAARGSRGASVREHKAENITEERTRREVGKYRGRALKGLMNYGNHKTVLSPYTHTEIACSKLVWEEVFTGPVLRESN